MKISFKDLKSTKARYGGYAALVTIAVLTIFVVLNLIVQAIPAQWDMTEEQIFSLSGQTLQILEDLDKEISLYGIYNTGQENKETTEVLLKYDAASSFVTYKTIDPELNPQFVKKFDEKDAGISRGTVIVDDGENFKVLTYTDLYQIQYNQEGQGQVVGVSIEKAVTSAIQYLKSGFTPKIYELTGHKEFSLATFGIDTLVTKENFSIEPLNLLNVPAVPEDATILLINSPQSDLLPEERDKIETFLNNSGRAYIFSDYRPEPLPVFEDLLATFGVAFNHGIVFENNARNQFQQNNPLWMLPNFGEHEIMEPISGAARFLYLFNATALKEAEIKKRNIEITPLLQTSTDSWIRRDVNAESMQRIPSDVKGPADLAYAVTAYKSDQNDPEPFKLILTGTSSPITSLYYTGQVYPGNIDYFLNGLAWLNDTDDSVSIRSKSLFMFRLQMTNVAAYIIAGIVVILIPLLVGGAGLIIWLRRRHL